VGHSIDPEKLSDVVGNFLGDLQLERNPYLAEHIEQHLDPSSHDDIDEFEFGLNLILDGLKRLRGRTRASRLLR